jgi:hypothetical protein
MTGGVVNSAELEAERLGDLCFSDSCG